MGIGTAPARPGQVWQDAAGDLPCRPGNKPPPPLVSSGALPVNPSSSTPIRRAIITRRPLTARPTVVMSSLPCTLSLSLSRQAQLPGSFIIPGRVHTDVVMESHAGKQDYGATVIFLAGDAQARSASSRSI